MELVFWWLLGVKRVVTKRVHVNTTLEDIREKGGEVASGTDSVYTRDGNGAFHSLSCVTHLLDE